MQLLCDISNNINKGLHWNQWTDIEKTVFTLCFYPDETNDNAKDVQGAKRCSVMLIRHLFNKLEPTPPKFIAAYYQGLKPFDFHHYREQANFIRERLFFKTNMRPSHKPPVH